MFLTYTRVSYSLLQLNPPAKMDAVSIITSLFLLLDTLLSDVSMATYHRSQPWIILSNDITGSASSSVANTLPALRYGNGYRFSGIPFSTQTPQNHIPSYLYSSNTIIASYILFFVSSSAVRLPYLENLIFIILIKIWYSRSYNNCGRFDVTFGRDGKEQYR